MAKKVTVKQREVALSMATRPHAKAHNDGAHLRPHHFKKGFDPRRNPGGKPKIMMKFAAAITEELMKPVGPEVAKALGLSPRARTTKYQALIVSTIQQAIGDWQAALGVREVLEGKLPNRNINVSASMERLLNDAGFRAFIESQLPVYLGAKGEDDDGTGLGATSGALGGEVQTEPDTEG